MFRYAHTNLIAKDAPMLIEFYKKVFHCKSIGETRDLSGEWLDKMTGVKNAHITGEHLLLPGYGEDHPTIEIFSYNEMTNADTSRTNKPGFAHIAFEVDDVEATMNEVLANGGSKYGELVTADYPNNMQAVFIYVCDPEGNIIEIQSWKKKA